MAMQWALAHGDTTGPRATVTAKLEQRSALLSPADYPPDGAYLDAHLLLALGVTAAAERTLGAPLNTLATLHSSRLSGLPVLLRDPEAGAVHSRRCGHGRDRQYREIRARSGLRQRLRCRRLPARGFRHRQHRQRRLGYHPT